MIRATRSHAAGLLAMLMLVLGVCTPAPGAPAESAPAIFEAANEAFETGAATLTEDPESARNDLEQAVALYAQLLDDFDIENAKLHYNIGNAYILLNDIGSAILHYRRAERLDTHNPNLAANLALARRQVPDRFEPESKTSFLRTVLFLHYDVPLQYRFWAAWSFFVLIWIVILSRQLVSRRVPVLWPAAVFGVLFITLSISVVIEAEQRKSLSEGVVVADRVEARKGPDENAYEPSFTQPLHAGVEFTIIERRDDWLRVQLPDGRETWLPKDAVAII